MGVVRTTRRISMRFEVDWVPMTVMAFVSWL